MDRFRSPKRFPISSKQNLLNYVPFLGGFCRGSIWLILAEIDLVGDTFGSESYPLSSGLRIFFSNGMSRYPSSTLSSTAQLFALVLDIIDFPLSKKLLLFRVNKVFHKVFGVVEMFFKWSAIYFRLFCAP